jgi:hypothetical protein
MAIRFDASADNITRTADLLDHNALYTFMAWVYLVSDLNSNSTFFVISDGSAGNYDWLRTTTDGVTLQARVEVGAAGTNSAGTALTVGQWAHLAMVRSSDTSLQIYLNGVLDITNTRDVSARAAVGKMEVSVLGAGSRADARFSAMKAWSTNLSQAEIASEMRVIRPVRLSNLYAWWPCFPGSGERARDYSGNGRNWAEGGTLTDEDPPPVGWGAPVLLVQQATTAAEISGTLSQTLGVLTATAAGTVGIQGTAAPTLGSLTLSGAGAVDLSGSLDKTLGTLTLSGAGTVDLAGAGAATLGALTSTGAGTVEIQGSLAQTLGALVSSGAGGADVTGALNQALGALTVTGAGGVEIEGELTQTLGALTLSGAGSSEIESVGDLDQALGALTASAVGTVEVQGTLTKTLGALTGAGAGAVEVKCDLAKTLGSLSLTAAGDVAGGEAAGVLDVTLGGLALTAAGKVAVSGQGGATLGALTLNGVGVAVLIVGIVRVSFSAKQPGVAFSGKKPTVTFSALGDD